MAELRYISAAAAYRRLRAGGRDAVDLLDRLCASDLDLRAVGSVSNGVATDERGRFLALFCALARKADELLLVSYAPAPGALAAHLTKYTIIEDAETTDCSEEWLQISAVGALSAELKAALADLDCVVFNSPLADAGALNELVYPRAQDAGVRAALNQNGAAEISRERFERIRVWHGWPAAGAELTDAVNPLDAGLKRLVSYTKGCFVGQEVLARLDTYDKVQWQIVKFQSPAPLASAAPIENADGVCGRVTSCVQLDDDATFIGLGYVKRKSYLQNAALKSNDRPLTLR